MTIAIDFDGTIVTHKFPKIGKKIPYAIEAVKQLKADGHKLILWTYRAGTMLQEAVDYCRKEGIVFDAINENYPGETLNESRVSRKIIAEVYIDDRNIGGLGDWQDIYKQISGKPLKTGK